MLVADAGQSVFAPAIGPAAGLVVREVVPGVAVGAVILAHGAPLSFGQIGPPQPPVARLLIGNLQAGSFGGRQGKGFHGHFFKRSSRTAVAQRSNAQLRAADKF